MNRKKKLALNSSTALIYQMISLACGFILPRIMLVYFGSEVNGLVSSVTQFLSLISLCELGVGSVVQSALYKPLAQKDEEGISKIVISSERFFRKIAVILLGYTVLLMVGYPLIVRNDFDYFYTFILIFVISISTFARYYFGMTYRLLLAADQLACIYYIVQSIALILNTIGCVVLIRFGASIQIVKLATSLIFLVQPMVFAVVAKRRYKIDRSLKLTEEPIKQKWNGIAQHLASVVLENTDTVVLTLMSTLENVSIYSVYHLVVYGVKRIIVAITNGTQALFGNMLAKKEMQQLEKTFDTMEWLYHTLVTLAFSITAMTILPFVTVYTQSVTDVNYIVPEFAYLITLAKATYCLRLPYNMMVMAAGHYKQTQASAIIEAVLNIVVSVALVAWLGLVGVAIGTAVAMLYRTCYLANYLSKNILNRKLKYFLRNLLIDILCVALSVVIIKGFSGFYALGAVRYSAWFVLAVKVGLTCLAVELIVNGVINREKVGMAVQLIRKKSKRNG